MVRPRRSPAHHVPVDLPEAAEQGGQRRDLAGLEQAPRLARGIDALLGAGRLDAGHADAAAGADLGKQRNSAGAAAAEGEVVAHHHVARADARGDNIGDEGGRLARGEGAVEARNVEDLHAERGEVAGLEAEGREPEGFVRGGQHLARMRLEGEHGKRRAEGARDARAFLDHRAVAEVDPVEIADGDDRAARVRGRGLPVPYDAHGRAVSLIRARGRICARPRLGQRRAGEIRRAARAGEATAHLPLSPESFISLKRRALASRAPARVDPRDTRLAYAPSARRRGRAGRACGPVPLTFIP